MNENFNKIKEKIESGALLCDGCPMQGEKDGYFVGDIEVSKACWICGAVEGRQMGTTEELIEEIGVDNLQYLIEE